MKKLKTIFSILLVSTVFFACKGASIRGVETGTMSDVANTIVTGQKLSASWMHTCAIVNAAGDVYCWGSNFYNNLGDNSTTHRQTAVKVLGITGATSVAAGQVHGCAVVSGNVYCWGDRTIYNTLGDNGPANTMSITAVQVQGLPAGKVTAISTSSGAHTCAIADSTAYCWGWKMFGQLGDGSGDGTMGTNSGSIGAVQVSGLTSGVTAIATGDKHSCAIQNGAVKCWGLNCGTTAGLPDCTGGLNYGQLGDNNASGAFSTIPVQVTGLTSGATSIALGQFYSCAVVNGGVQCWGRNASGQLGNATNNNSPIPVQTFGLTSGSGVTSVSAGLQIACALVNGGAKCWGTNWVGQLGVGTNGNSSNFPLDVIGLSSGVTAITPAGNHTCAIHNTTLKCWGENVNGVTPYGSVGDGSGAEQDMAVAVQVTW